MKEKRDEKKVRCLQMYAEKFACPILLRKDPFDLVWEECHQLLEQNSGLEVKQLFQQLQSNYPCRFSDGQISSFQRKVKSLDAL